ncbi:flagellin [Laribacter hongkongensis]|uniref:flagellin n=2 Tax=Laribacter hongkongensis TaxID=168471 RepID=UPI0023D86BC5|nr:flagellin [Laribacter hongkongensis]
MADDKNRPVWGGFLLSAKNASVPLKFSARLPIPWYDSGAAGSRPDRSPGIVNIVSTRPKPKENTMLGINTNVTSLTSQRNLSNTTNSMQTTLQRLSSGLRINSAKDDAAGLAISERMTSQVRGLDQARRNANDGISLAQTAEGSLVEIGNNMQRMRELAIQSANDTNTASDRATIQKEMDQLKSEIDRVASTTEFNGQKLLDGSFSAKKFQVGANADQTISLSTRNAQTSALGASSLTIDGTLNQAMAAKAAVPAANTVLAGEDLSISGPLGSNKASIDLAAGADGKAIVSAVNKETANTGVTAEAVSKAQMTIAVAGSATFELNGTSITANITDTTDLSALAEAVNAKSSTTGVKAEVDVNDKSKLVFVAEDGRNIGIGNFATTGAPATAGTVATVRGMDAFTNDLTGTAVNLTDDAAHAAANTDSTLVGATVRFNATEGFTVKSAATAAATNGLFVTAAANGSALSGVDAIDVSTQSGSNDAIRVLDAALGTINSQRANLGAIQNRFASTITNLQTTSENLSASRSRIKDADFAQETANLSRNQVLQQAGTAMLAQANQGPQIALQLLR